jgi:hypothetical protein
LFQRVTASSIHPRRNRQEALGHLLEEAMLRLEDALLRGLALGALPRLATRQLVDVFGTEAASRHRRRR